MVNEENRYNKKAFGYKHLKAFLLHAIIGDSDASF